jgi:hypothetical protein
MEIPPADQNAPGSQNNFLFPSPSGLIFLHPCQVYIEEDRGIVACMQDNQNHDLLDFRKKIVRILGKILMADVCFDPLLYVFSYIHPE